MQKYTLNMFEKHGVSFKDAFACNSSTARLSTAVLNGYLAIGSSYWMDEQSPKDFFRSVIVPDSNINYADLCIAYQPVKRDIIFGKHIPENTLASRFASYLQNMHFDEEYSEMETLIID